MDEVEEIQLLSSEDGGEEEQPQGPSGSGSEKAALLKQLEATNVEIKKVEREISRLMDRQHALRAERDRLQRLIQAEEVAPRKDWARGKFPWDAQAMDVLRQVFGLSSFRPLQREVCNATLQGRDVLCLLPSGGGKSLCYQLPALMDMQHHGQQGSAEAAGAPPGGSSGGGGLTLVISPLLSLIHDQVAQLHALGVAAASLTSLSSKEESNEVFDALTAAAAGPARAKGAKGAASGGSGSAAGAGAQGGMLRLLYVTPERVVASKRLMGKLEKLYAAGRLARVAIDEAHCASQWGNDFRPDYKKLGVIRTMFPKVPIIALTATATLQVREDVCKILGIDGCETFAASINRPNLHYSVVAKPKDDASSAIAAWISANYPDGESGIVYALTRKDCETLAAELQAAGLAAVHYHADMPPAERQEAHQAWSSGQAQVLVGTIAFGMGINKPDVRFVVHASLSKSVENYYQESGRAGRDGKPARCVLYYRFSDVLRQAAIVCYEPNWWPNLMAMTQYAASVQACRRAMQQEHFAEAPADCRCMCDNCAHRALMASCVLESSSKGASSSAGSGGAKAAAGPSAGVEEVDVKGHALVLLGVLKTLGAGGKKATLLQAIDAWRKEDKATAKAMSREEQEQVVEHLLLEGFLELDFGSTAYATNVYLRISGRGHRLLEGPGPVKQLMPRRMQAPAWAEEDNEQEAGAGSSAGGGGAGGAARALRVWRTRRAAQGNVFPQAVLPAALMPKLAVLGWGGPGATAAGAAAAGPGQGLQEQVVQVLGPVLMEQVGQEVVDVLQAPQAVLAEPQRPAAEAGAAAAGQHRARKQAQGPGKGGGASLGDEAEEEEDDVPLAKRSKR